MMASKLDVLDGHNVVDPTHVDNTTGLWLCDGRTTHQWASEGMRRCQAGGTMPPDAVEAMAISGALQALDNNEEELDFFRNA